MKFHFHSWKIESSLAGLYILKNHKPLKSEKCNFTLNDFLLFLFLCMVVSSVFTAEATRKWRQSLLR